MAQTKYEADDGAIHSMQMSAAKVAADGNAEPAAAIDSPIKVKISKSNRSFGIRPRGIRLSRVLTGGSGAEAVSATKYAFLPIRTKAIFDGATLAKGTTITIGALVWTIGDRVAEDY